MANRYFRASLRGFNRKDVVEYIEYLNQQHAAQISQLTNQLKTAQEAENCDELRKQLEAANARCAQLEEALAKLAPAEPECDELELYRRAERTERMAKERASQIYHQANAVLADATVKAEEASTGICAMADDFSHHLANYQASVQSTRDSLQAAVAALYSIRPEE